MKYKTKIIINIIPVLVWLVILIGYIFFNLELNKLYISLFLFIDLIFFIDVLLDIVKEHLDEELNKLEEIKRNLQSEIDELINNHLK